MRRMLAAVAFICAAAAPAVWGQTQFTFTKADLKLLADSDAMDRQFESRAMIYHDAALEKHLTDIATPLLPRAPLENVQWKFRILRAPIVNAFALPNGTIYVCTGLLARTENDDQLASVLAHEATHVTNRHTYIFDRSVRKKVVASEIVAIAAAWTPLGGWYAAVSAAGANVSQLAMVAMIYGYSRELEAEADHNGLDRLRQAGYDPTQMIRMFDIMDEKLEPVPVPYFLNDHPKIKDRIGYLKTALGVTGDVGAISDGGYLARMRPVLIQNIQLDLDSRQFRSAVAGAERLATAYPEDAVAQYWLGEAYRELGPRETRLSAAESTAPALRAGYRRTRRLTEAEETKALADTPEGRAALDANGRKAEAAFLKASAINPSLPDAHLGLGALYEQQGKWDAALAAYRQGLAISTKPGQRQLTQGRIDEVQSRSQAGGKGDSK